MSKTTSDLQRKLKIKTGTCKRLHKELLSYMKETQEQQEKVSKMRAEHADGYDIRKQEEVLSETTNMIGDTTHRFEVAIKDLSDQLELTEKAPEGAAIASTEDWKIAKETLEAARGALKK